MMSKSRWTIGITAMIAVLCNIGIGYAQGPDISPGVRSSAPAADAPTTPKTYPRLQERLAMVKSQIASRSITTPGVLKAMGHVPRHLFMPKSQRYRAYGDHPVRIGHRQTISQPFIVAYMTQALNLKPTDRVLEIGTGSGYQAAVLAEQAAKVYTIEIVEPLGRRAKALLDELGYKNIYFRIGDGYAGWPKAAPFDAIMLTAAPPKIPRPLLEQLKIGGVMIAPVGKGVQELLRVTRTADGFRSEKVMGVRFVPMTGRAQSPEATPSK